MTSTTQVTRVPSVTYTQQTSAMEFTVDEAEDSSLIPDADPEAAEATEAEIEVERLPIPRRSSRKLSVHICEQAVKSVMMRRSCPDFSELEANQNSSSSPKEWAATFIEAGPKMTSNDLKQEESFVLMKRSKTMATANGSAIDRQLKNVSTNKASTSKTCTGTKMILK